MADPQKTVYIDEKTGKDDASATGEESSPFQSLNYAYITTDGAATYLVRKYEENADPSWAPASKAGTKKAVTALQTHKKKAAKEQELVVRQKKEQEARDKVLEEAKKIVITEDKSLPAPVKIQLDEVGGELKLHKEGSEEKGTRVRVLGRFALVRRGGGTMAD
jgi:asparaginyl-tRNA synthetase